MPSAARVLVAALGVLAVPVLALASPGTAAATATPSPSPSASPTDPAPTCLAVCLKPSPTAGPSATPAATPTATAARTHSPTPSPTPRRAHRSTYSPRPTYSTSQGSTENPVTGTVHLGGVARGSATPDPTLTPKETSGTTHRSDPITRLVVLVLGAAVLLGVGGVTGLYLTRHRHGHPHEH